MNTLKTLTVLLFKNWLRSRVAIFFGILFPIMLFLVFGSIFGGPSPPSYTLYVRNLDIDSDGRPSLLSDVFVKVLNSTVFEVRILSPGETPRQTGFAAVRILTIPKGFTAGLLNKTVANRVDIMVDTIMRLLEMGGGNITADARENIERGLKGLESFKQTLNTSSVKVVLGGSADDRLLQPIDGIIRNISAEFELRLLNASKAIELETVTVNVRQLKAVDYYLPGYIAAFIMTNGLIGVSSVVSDFRRNGVVKLLASTNIGKTVWIASLMITQTAAAIILTAVMVAVGWAVFGIRALPDPLSLGIIVMGAAAFTGLGILIGGVVKEADAVSALGNLLSFPQMFLSGAFWPMELMPSFMQQVAQLVPLYHFHNALRSTLIMSNPEPAAASLAVVVATTVLAVCLAIAATRWKDF
jgi:ABC-2 type transport system permease protein